MGYKSGGGGLWTEITNGAELIISSQDICKLTHGVLDSNTTGIEGADATGDDLNIKANQTDTYPFIRLTGNSNVMNYLGTTGRFLIYAATTEIGGFTAVSSAYSLNFRETASSPATKTNFGQLYTKSDNKLYFKDGGGTEHEVAFV